MANSVLNFGSNGLATWLWQRISAVYLLIYTLGCYLAYLQLSRLQVAEIITYQSWLQFIRHSSYKYLHLTALYCLLIHAWIGLWTVCTDYIKVRWLRVFLLLGNLSYVLGMMVWGTKIILA